MAGTEYVALHEGRVTTDDGELYEFAPGQVYDGPPRHVEKLLKGNRRLGPVIAKKASDEGKAAFERAQAEEKARKAETRAAEKADQDQADTGTPTATPAATDTSSKGN